MWLCATRLERGQISRFGFLCVYRIWRFTESASLASRRTMVMIPPGIVLPDFRSMYLSTHAPKFGFSNSIGVAWVGWPSLEIEEALVV